MKALALTFATVIALASLAHAQNTRVESFNKAKRLAAQVYAGHEKTLYCGCTYKDKKIDLESCGYKPRNPKYAEKLWWEHVVPAEAFGQSFAEWRNGHPDCVDNKGKKFKGRNCARKVSRTFRLMEADLYNLFPESAELNRLRSNYSMEMLPGEPREFGSCDIEISDRKVEPRPDIRGDIARTYLYMHQAYPGHGVISRSNQKLFEVWDKEDPVDDWERERAKRIEGIQGNSNLFVK